MAAPRGTDQSVLDFTAIDRRITLLKEKIRMRDLLTHFGHSYRTNGNMLCVWHDEQNPSAKLYDAQDTYWCWACSPGHGIDIIEFVIVELTIEADLSYIRKDKSRRALAVLRAVEYLENAFGFSYHGQPWEIRLNQALHRKLPVEDPERYWRDQHTHFVRLLSTVDNPDKWNVYAELLQELYPKRLTAIALQVPLWREYKVRLSDLN